MVRGDALRLHDPDKRRDLFSYSEWGGAHAREEAARKAAVAGIAELEGRLKDIVGD